MVEAGADEIPEDVLLEAFELAHARDHQASARRRRTCAARPASRSGSTPSSTEELEQRRTATRIRAADRGGRPARGGRGRRGARRTSSAPPLSMDSAEEDILRRTQVESSLAQILDKMRLDGRRGAGPRAVRRRPARADRRGAGLEGAEVREAAPALRADHRDLELPFPVGPATADGEPRRSKDALTTPVRQARGRGDLQGARPQEDRGRQAPARRSRPGGDPPDRVRGGRQPAHARLGALHARPDADHVAAHARHREGGAADRRPLARAGAPLHAPLQLPALLGRGDGLHARARSAATSATARSRSGRSSR